MNDNEIKLEIDKELTKIAEKHGIYHLSEQESYFKFRVNKGVIYYDLPDMPHNDFIIEAIEVVHNFRGDKI